MLLAMTVNTFIGYKNNRKRKLNYEGRQEGSLEKTAGVLKGGKMNTSRLHTAPENRLSEVWCYED